MTDPVIVRLLSEIRDIQHVIAERHRFLVVISTMMAILGVVFCAAFLAEIAVVITSFLVMR
jgi:hypothetical protein